MSDTNAAAILSDILVTFGEVDAIASSLAEHATSMPGQRKHRSVGNTIVLAVMLERLTGKLRKELDEYTDALSGDKAVRS